MATRYKVVLYPVYVSAIGITGFQRPIAPGSQRIGNIGGNDLEGENSIINFYAEDGNNTVTLKTLRESGTASPELVYFPNDECKSAVTVTLTDSGDGITYTVDDADIAQAIKDGAKDCLHFELTI